MTVSRDESLRERIAAIGDEARFDALAVALHDYERDWDFEQNGDGWFHAASTFKVGVLFALFKAAENGMVRLDDQLHVRNRFRSVIDGSIYRIDVERDGDPGCHRRVGRSLKLAELAHAMITRSSNLATNLLLDFLGVEAVQSTLRSAGIHGIKVIRGVEDHRAFQEGVNNQATARGLVQLFRSLCEGSFFSEFSRQQLRDILLAQEFNSMIPARLPSTVKVAHKTGEISDHWHDAGIVSFPDRKPYVLAILTHGPPTLEQPQRAVAAISEAIFQAVVT